MSTAAAVPAKSARRSRVRVRVLCMTTSECESDVTAPTRARPGAQLGMRENPPTDRGRSSRVERAGVLLEHANRHDAGLAVAGQEVCDVLEPGGQVRTRAVRGTEHHDQEVARVTGHRGPARVRSRRTECTLVIGEEEAPGEI